MRLNEALVLYNKKMAFCKLKPYDLSSRCIVHEPTSFPYSTRSNQGTRLSILNRFTTKVIRFYSDVFNPAFIYNHPQHRRKPISLSSYQLINYCPTKRTALANNSFPFSQKLRNKTSSAKYVTVPRPMFCTPN